MKRVLLFAAGLLALLLVSGCSTLSQKDCQVGDWQAIGRADGAAGRPLSRMADHEKRCGDFGIAVNRKLYEAGRREGLKSYCTLAKAKREGLADRTYYNVCEGQIGISFCRVYEAAQDVERLNGDLDALRRKRDELSRRISDPALTPQQANMLRADLMGVQLEMSSLNLRISAAERTLDKLIAAERKRLAALGISA